MSMNGPDTGEMLSIDASMSASLLAMRELKRQYDELLTEYTTLATRMHNIHHGDQGGTWDKCSSVICQTVQMFLERDG